MMWINSMQRKIPMTIGSCLLPHRSSQSNAMQSNPVSQKAGRSPDCSLQLESMKSESLVIADQQVRSTHPMYSGASTLAGGFPHSDISGSTLVCQLPEAFRRLPRPSSPLSAKAFTKCS